MKEIRIRDLKPGVVRGVQVALPHDTPYRETYFEWTPSPLVASFKTPKIGGGSLLAWKQVPQFSEAEYHVDAELFFFLSGTAIMMFADIAGDRAVMKSVQIVRIRPGTRILVPAGKGHFVPVAEGTEPVFLVVASPKMDAPRVPLPEAVRGVA